MLNPINNTTVSSPENTDELVLLSSMYDALLPDYSVRTNNVLQSLRDRFPDKASFLDGFIQMSWKEIAGLKNCGRKTIQEVLAIQSILKQHRTIQTVVESKENRPTLPGNTDALLPLITPRLSGLSVRTKNAFLKFLEEHNNSLVKLYAAISEPSFNPGKVRNIGRGTVAEIKGLFEDVKCFLESFPDEQSVEEALHHFNSKTLNDIRIPADSQEMIRELEATLGHFPLFAAINTYFENLEGESRAIIDGCLNMHLGQVLPDRTEVAASLCITAERVRQKRNKLIDSLTEYFASFRTLGFVTDCPYNYQMRRINEDINAQEGTDFNLNFVNWVLASTFEEVTLLGDAAKTLTGYYDKEFFLCLVPTDLCRYMDFNSFLEDVETRLAEKRINEEKVNLQNLINAHLKTQYCEDEMPAIETACRSILYLHFPVEVDFGQVIFKPNARKNNPIIIEEILRAAGHPLTLEEIYEEFIYQYPERYTEMNSLRGSVNINPNIIPIGRSSTYTLAEWEGETLRGGSIRKIVADYLRELEPTIASMSDITEHVCQFRPTTDEYNILTNLSLEQTGMFSFYFKEGIRYIGLSENTYPLEYFQYSGDARNATAMSIGYPKLLSFITENKRFPFSSGVDDVEMQLCGFWRRQQRYYEAGELSASGLAYHTRILSDFGHLIMTKKAYLWLKAHNFAEVYFERRNPLLVTAETQSEFEQWFDNLIEECKSSIDSMPEWKKEAIKELFDLYLQRHNVQDNLG